MEKVFGATERHDALVVFNRTGRAVLVYGYGEEDGQGYDWRHTFDSVPTKKQLAEVLVTHINAQTDAKILTGFVWQGNHVYLSMENQFNFKTAYDVAVLMQGATLPVKFKLGEDADGNPVYHTFEDMVEFTDFYTKAVAFVNLTLNEGWQLKDDAVAWAAQQATSDADGQ